MHNTYNWPAYCRKYGITADELKAIAAELGLPMAKLNSTDSQRLLHELESRHSQQHQGDAKQRSFF